MTGLLESPLPALLGGGLMTAILIGGWIQTARLWPLYASVGVIAVTVLLVLLEHHVETDREKIASTLQDLIQVVEHNDLDGLLEHIHPEAIDIQQKARREFPNYHFSAISVRPNLEVTTRGGSPTTARATFNVVADGSIVDLGMGDATVRRYVELDFKQHAGSWKVVNYAHFEPLRGMRDQYSNRY